MVQLVHGKNLGIGKAAEERHRSGAEKAGKQSQHPTYPARMQRYRVLCARWAQDTRALNVAIARPSTPCGEQTLMF